MSLKTDPWAYIYVGIFVGVPLCLDGLDLERNKISQGNKHGNKHMFFSCALSCGGVEGNRVSCQGFVRIGVSENDGINTERHTDTCTEKYGRSFARQIDQTCDQALRIRKQSGSCFGPPPKHLKLLQTSVCASVFFRMPCPHSMFA